MPDLDAGWHALQNDTRPMWLSCRDVHSRNAVRGGTGSRGTRRAMKSAGRSTNYRAWKRQAEESLYLPPDVADRVRMGEIFAWLEGRYEQVHGIFFHAAGIITADSHDAIAQTTRQKIDAHFAAKVRGTLVLAQLLESRYPYFRPLVLIDLGHTRRADARSVCCSEFVRRQLRASPARNAGHTLDSGQLGHLGARAR